MNPLLDPDLRLIIGHRGASGSAPENTIASFDLALAQGAEAFELDVRISADGVPVVFHDPTLDRTTGEPGTVQTRTAAELAQLDAGATYSADGLTYPFRGQGVGVPTLAEILRRYPDTPLLIELKEVAAAAPVQDAIRAAGATDRVVVASFLAGALDPFPSPPFLIGASRRDILRHYLRSGIGLGPRRGDTPRCYAVPVRYKDLIPVPTGRFVAAARRAGRPVHVWTVNDIETAERLWDLGCAGMITNYPALLLEARNRRFGAPLKS